MRDSSEKMTRRLSAKVMSVVLVVALAMVCVVPAAAAFAADVEDEAVENAVAVEETVSGDEETAELEGAITRSITIIVRGVAVATRAIVTHLDQSEAVTLSGDVYINEDTTCGPIIVGEGGLNLIIKDGVTLTIDCTGMNNYAAIRCNDNDSWLTITAGADGDETPLGTGRVVVHGADYCAGIGGNDNSAAHNITIEACEVYAYGGRTLRASAADAITMATTSPSTVGMCMPRVEKRQRA